MNDDPPRNQMAKAIPQHPPFWYHLKQNVFFWSLLAICGTLTLVAPKCIVEYPALIDWYAIAALAGLLILTRVVEVSGILQLLDRRLIEVVSSQRILVLSLVAASATLSTVSTNDVVLFVIVPLTIGLRQVANLPVAWLVTFEALAVSAGSTLTPTGNPQNLFLWHQSGLSFDAFVWQMAPMVVLLMALLLLVTWLAFASHETRPHAETADVELHKRLLVSALALYMPFLVLTDLGHPLVAATGLIVLYLIGARYVLTRVDWDPLLVFMLMFTDLRLMAQLDVVWQAPGALALNSPMHLCWTGIGVSQIISNVPAATLLTEYSHDWPMIAFAVSVGDFGTLIGSLANLIALRMLGDRRVWWVFHMYSMPFLLAAGGIVYVWLIWLRWADTASQSGEKTGCTWRDVFGNAAMAIWSVIQAQAQCIETG